MPILNIILAVLNFNISMSASYKVKVNDLYDFDLDTAELSTIDSLETAQHNYHILANNQSFDVKVLASDFNKKTYTVEVNGNSYSVNISNALDRLIDDLGLAVSATKKENDVKAPMPGLIVSVSVSEGQEVKEGEGILVLEAMKMENTLVAPKDGIVKSIAVSAGDKVDKNAVLIEME